jgi:hypothetical protein
MPINGARASLLRDSGAERSLIPGDKGVIREARTMSGWPTIHDTGGTTGMSGTRCILGSLLDGVGFG